uniref:TAP42-like protein n=1 Tax=Globisporangium ultimum (strain ATCC 200006 / CBS 805.95 / DAOM BR144) TaxID=431595 RepID=K3X0R5_GLOUD
MATNLSGLTTTTTAASSASDDRVSYAEAYQRFMALENPSTAVGDTNSKAFQDELDATLALLRKCVTQRQLDGALSENESFFELQNTQLYAFCLEYYLAMLIPKQTFFQQPDSAEQLKQQHQNQRPTAVSNGNDQTRNIIYRIKFLRDADVFHTEFLDRAEQMGILQAKKRREQYERMDAKQFSLSRDEKIQRFQMQREMEKKLQEVQKRKQQQSGKKPGATANADDEDEFDFDDDMDELEREQLMAFIQLAVIKSMDEQMSINQEREMLETMIKMNAKSDKKDLFTDAHRPPPPPQGQGISVTHINPQFEMRRETVKSGVFKPGHRLPTMSLQEYADMELADAQERQQREQEASQGPRRYDQLVEDGDEDNLEFVDEATYKDRAWDDWKDANPRGIGNKKGSQF